MGCIENFKDDSFGCWALVNLEDKSPLYISVAQTGVIVKKSRFGIFGPKLFEEDVIHRLASLCQKIDSKITNYSTPPKMKNPILKMFAQIALDSESCTDFLIRLRSYTENE